MGKVPFNKDYKNCHVTIFEDDVINTYKIADIIDDTLEYQDGLLPVSEGKKYFDLTTGGIHYFYNVDLPTKIEAKNLKTLRRSTALKNLFVYDKSKKFDLVGFMPWLITVLVILFK